MPSNLPPGVSVSDIPGNRPEDEWAEKFWDAVELPADLMEFPPELVSTITTLFLSRLDEALTLAFKAGQREAEMRPRYEHYHTDGDYHDDCEACIAEGLGSRRAQ